MSVNWSLKKISDICEFQNNKRVPLKSLDREKRQGEYPYYGASGIVDYIDNYIFDGKFLLISEDGENLRTRNTPIAFQAQGRFWVNNHAHILAEKEEGILDYLEYYFSILNINPYITGAVQPKLNKANLDAIEIPIPPVNERLLINQILNSLKEKILLNNQINQTLESIAQALFKSWFIDFEPVRAKIAAKQEGKDPELAAMCAISGKTQAELEQMAGEDFAELQATAALFPDELVESELGEVPRGWEVSTIGKRFNVVMGQSPKGDTYNGNKHGKLFFQGRAEFGWRYPTPRLYTTDPKRVAKENDILMSVRAPVGDMNVAMEECCIGRGLSALSHRSGSFSYSYYCLKALQSKFNVFNGEGTVFGSINQNDLKNISFIEPINELIDLFAKTINKYDQRIKLNSFNTKSLIDVRDTLLPKLLSGEMDVSDLQSEGD